MGSQKNNAGLFKLSIVVVLWFLITLLVPKLNALVDLRSINPWILAYVRMALIFIVTWIFVRNVENKDFSSGFNFRFSELPRALVWAIVFFGVAYLAEQAYQTFVLGPLLSQDLTASSTGAAAEVGPLPERVFEYLYIVFEGVVEVLVFIGFLLDRLQKHWGWTLSILVSNVVFALWHFPYLGMGLLPGSLLITLTFVAGCIISLNFMITRNTLSAILCHLFVDSPSALRILLGK